MRAHLSYLWERVSASYWLVPSSILVFAFALSFSTLFLDYRTGPDYFTGLLWFQYMDADAARAFLSVIASSMITVAGVVFSITIVALTLAANQYGPRLLRTFHRNRGNQVVLGVFVATFAYCLTIMRFLGRSGFVPFLSTIVAMGLAMLSLMLLIYFIHHVSVSIQASSIIGSADGELSAAIDALYPEAPPQGEGGSTMEDPDPHPALDEEASAGVLAEKKGYTVRVDYEGLLELARESDVCIRVDAEPGSFVLSGGRVASVWPGETLGSELSARISDAIVLGNQRTVTQDVVFGMNQLVEVAVRALSPGINDPFTAIHCLDMIGEALSRVARRTVPSPYRRDDAGRIRVIGRSTGFSDLADAGLDQIRQNGRGNAAVTTRLMQTLAAVAPHVHREEDQRACLRHAELVRRSAETGLAERSDYEVVAACFRRIAPRLEREPGPEVRSG